MGNKTSKRDKIDEQFTKPQGLYSHPHLDRNKLRKLILNKRLAPCYPGHDDTGELLEECPICTLNYPSLNRSNCCRATICTECFLQMKSPQPDMAVRCPFCNASVYTVDYCGPKSSEERQQEEAEQQKVLEAQIRARNSSLKAEERQSESAPESRNHSQVDNLSSEPPQPTSPSPQNRRPRFTFWSGLSGVQVEELVNRRAVRGRSRSEEIRFVMPGQTEEGQANPGQAVERERVTPQDRRVVELMSRFQSSDDGLDTEILRLALWESIREREAQLMEQHAQNSDLQSEFRRGLLRHISDTQQPGMARPWGQSLPAPPAAPPPNLLPLPPELPVRGLEVGASQPPAPSLPLPRSVRSTWPAPGPAPGPDLSALSFEEQLDYAVALSLAET